MQNHCAEIKLRVERRAGEMLHEVERKPGVRIDQTPLPKEERFTQTLKDSNVPYSTAYKWQLEATVPEPVFERHVAEVKARGDELTNAGLLREAVNRGQSNAERYYARNLLMFNPYTTLDDVEEDLQFVEDMAADGSVPVSIARVEIYSGTPLHRQLASEGRLLGTYRAWDYQIVEPASELLFRQVLAAMQRRNYHPEGLSKTAIQAYYELLIYRNYYPEHYDESFSRQLAAIVARLNRHSLAIIRRLAKQVKRGDLYDVAEVNRRTIAAALETNRVDAELEARLRRWRRRLHSRVAVVRGHAPSVTPR